MVGMPKHSFAVETTQEGWRIELPRLSLFRAGHGLFWIGLCFCLGSAIISAAFIILPQVGSTEGGVYTPPSHEPMPTVFFVAIGLLWTCSLGTTAFAINMSVRRDDIELTANSLRINQVAPFLSRLAEIPRSSIAAIQRGPSGLAIGGTKETSRSGAEGKGVDQLHIYTNEGKRLRFFTGRTTSELEALATFLREKLGVSVKKYDGG